MIKGKYPDILTKVLFNRCIPDKTLAFIDEWFKLLNIYFFKGNKKVLAEYTFYFFTDRPHTYLYIFFTKARRRIDIHFKFYTNIQHTL